MAKGDLSIWLPSTVMGGRGELGAINPPVYQDKLLLHGESSQGGYPI
jgi:hypothetical protein